MKIITRKYLLIFCLNYIRNKRKGLPDNGNRRGAAPLEDNEKEPCFLRHGSVCRKSSPAAIFSDRLAPSAYSLANIGVLCAAAHSPCICSHLRVALGLWPNSPQGWRFPSVPTASPGGGRRKETLLRKASESTAHVAGFGFHLEGPQALQTSPKALLTV